MNSPPLGERRINVTLAPEDGGVRLDRALQRQLPEVSRTRLKQLILDGRIASAGPVVRDPPVRGAPMRARGLPSRPPTRRTPPRRPSRSRSPSVLRTTI